MSCEVLYPFVLAARGQSRALPPPERVQGQSAGARVAVHASARRRGAHLGVLLQDEEDAPLATNGWNWSVSHNGHLVAGVVGRTPLGIDLERIEARREAWIRAVADDDERARFALFDTRALIRLWTAKEAVLKRAGVGLGELSRCRLVDRPRPESMTLEHRGECCLVRQAFLEDHVLSIHARGDAWRVRWPEGCLA